MAIKASTRKKLEQIFKAQDKIVGLCNDIEAIEGCQDKVHPSTGWYLAMYFNGWEVNNLKSAESIITGIKEKGRKVN